MYGEGAGNIVGTGTGRGSKVKIVDDLAARDLLVGKIGDRQQVIVKDATADFTILDHDKPRATYIFHKDGIPSTWEKVAEEESVDIVLYSNLPDDALTSQAYGDFPIGTRWDAFKGLPLMQFIRDFLFQTVPYSYTNPVTNLNDISGKVEVGDISNYNLIASLTQNDGGPVNRVIIKRNGLPLQDTSAPGEDYDYDDIGRVHDDGEQSQYQATIHYDQGPEQTDVSGKGIVSPGRIEAGFDDSPIYTLAAHRYIYAGMSLAKPVDSDNVRLMPIFQWDDDYNMTLQIQVGDSSVTIVPPFNRTILSIVEHSALGLTNDITAQMLASEEIIAVEGASPGYTQNARLYHFEPEAVFTSAGTYEITFTNV